jgi:hypothetical protein
MTSVVRFIERRKAAFDPEELAVLIAAYDEAWDRLSASGRECTRPAYARAMREVVARRILEVARREMTGAGQIAAEAVRFLALNYRHEAKSKTQVASPMAKPSGLQECGGDLNQNAPAG